MSFKSVRVPLCCRRILVLAGLLFWFASEAGATVYYVDYRVAAGGNGLSWAGAKKTIMAAVALTHPGDEIWVAQGLYPEAIGLPSGVSLYGGFAGSETALSQRQLSGASILDGTTAYAGGPADHVVTAANVTGVRLDGFIVTGGLADGTGESGVRGGGLFANNVASAVIANCTFVGNSTASGYGQAGGAYIVGGTAVFQNCVFQDNASGEFGGALCCYQGTVTVQNCVFRGNSAYSAGAVFCAGNSTVAITGCRFENNAALMFGGALEVRDATTLVSDSSFVGNLGSEGGSVMGFNAILLQVQRCTFVGNTGSTYGGGLAAYGSHVVMGESTFVGNAAGYRGGGAIEVHQGFPFEASNCVFVGNTAQGGGGGILVADQPCKLYNCTLASNQTSSSGGAVCVEGGGSLDMRNSLVTDEANLSVVIASTVTLQSLDHCFFSNNPQGDFLWSSNTMPLTGAALIEVFVPQAEGTVDGFAGFQPGETGTLTSASTYDAAQNRTLLTDVDKAFPVGALKGSILSIVGAADTYSYVTDNDDHSLTVFGNIAGAAVNGAEYRFLNVHLGGGSACIDRGTSTDMPLIDIDGDVRGYDVSAVGEGGMGAFYDIGADESIDPDTDGDGLSDGLEVFLGSSPNAIDSDGDGLPDLGEYIVYGTDPARQDTDGDWFTDGEELNAGSDPKSPASIPYPVGDVNRSSRCDATDVQAVINGALGKNTAYRTDIDLSGRTDARDVQLVINAVLNQL